LGFLDKCVKKSHELFHCGTSLTNYEASAFSCAVTHRLYQVGANTLYYRTLLPLARQLFFLLWLFRVSRSRSLALSLSRFGHHAGSLCRSLSLSLSHSLSDPRAPSRWLWLSVSLSHSGSASLSASLTHTLPHSLSLALSLRLSHSLSLPLSLYLNLTLGLTLCSLSSHLHTLTLFSGTVRHSASLSPSHPLSLTHSLTLLLFLTPSLSLDVTQSLNLSHLLPRPAGQQVMAAAMACSVPSSGLAE
jgi:hypothetical protein